MEAGALVNVEDLEGNTPLHVKCYGEVNKPAEMEAINMLLECGAKIALRNSKVKVHVHGII